MKNCIDSLLPGGKDIEIIIVNDGSTDGTSEIAHEYEKQYPDIVRVIDKENGGHGSGVNAGVAAAEGMYFKVVDSDDRLDEYALKCLIYKIREHVLKGCAADLYITNFVYAHEDGNNYRSDYVNQMPVDRLFTWADIKPLRLWKMLLMHSLVYNTKKLRESGLVLPEKTFYVDNLFAYQPLPHMETLYYLNVDMYMYFIGRADQSVTVANMSKRYEQQIRVMKLMFESYTYDEIMSMCKPLRKLMFHCLGVILLNTYFFTTVQDSPERRKNLKELMDGLKARDRKLYGKMKYRTPVALLNPLPWKLKGKVTTMSYKFLCKHVKLGVWN